MSETPRTERRFAAVIPALNEAASIRAVVEAVVPYADPIVVDDGSTDSTGALAAQSGADVVSHPTTKGYDAALESGLRHASERGFEFAITMDADGQHKPELLADFEAELERGAKLVVGIRDRRQRVAEVLFACFTRTLWGIQDPLCGMKGYSLDVYRAAGRFDTYRSVGTELTLRICRTGLRIAQLPVPTRARAGAPRFGAGLRPNLRILRSMIIGLCRTRRITGAAPHSTGARTTS